MSTVRQIDYAVDLLRVLTWQRNNAANLQGLLSQKQAWYDENVSKFWEDWERDVFNLDTANDFGLTVWAIILDQPLIATVPASGSTTTPFGFGSNNANFGRGNFRRTTDGTISLSIEQRRALLKMRYAKLVSRGSVPEINSALAILSGGAGAAYVVDSDTAGPLTVVFDYTPSAGIRFVLENMDPIPRPAGVGIGYAYPYVPFGLSETEDSDPAHNNFYFATFAEG